MKYKDDPVIKRIRDVRHEISAKFDHDPGKLVAHYIELQKKYANRIVKPPRQPEPAEVVTKQ